MLQIKLNVSVRVSQHENKSCMCCLRVTGDKIIRSTSGRVQAFIARTDHRIKNKNSKVRRQKVLGRFSL